MCFTLAGRIQTRLAVLAGPALLAGWFAAASDKLDYWWLFGLMVAAGLSLDIGVYYWLIDYQPRWLTLVLAAAEFWLLKWIVEWPYPLEIRLRTRQALIFYFLAWTLIWLTLVVVLPRIFPRWSENNGVLYAARRSHVRARQALTCAQRRRAYVRTALCLGIVLLPWAVASAATSSHSVMTGLLVNEAGHVRALSEATAAAGSGSITSLAGVIGWMAVTGRWPVLPLYQGTWVIAAALLILGLQVAWRPLTFRQLLALCMITPWLPCSWLLAAAAVVWVWSAGVGPQMMNLRLRRSFGLGLQVSGALLWSYLWLRLATAPVLYIDQGTWQALTWVRQSTAPETPVAVGGDLQPIVAALTGHPVVDATQPAPLHLTTGTACTTAQVKFQHGTTCIVASPKLVERP